MTTPRPNRFLLAALLAFGVSVAACSDEDGDGAVTDEEIDQIDEELEDLGDDIEEEIDEGTAEVED